jgi:hypothetical protein
MRLVKCTTSFMIGFYLAFVLTLSVTGYIMVEGFIPKHILDKSSFYMDGEVYEVKKR